MKEDPHSQDEQQDTSPFAISPYLFLTNFLISFSSMFLHHLTN